MAPSPRPAPAPSSRRTPPVDAAGTVAEWTVIIDIVDGTITDRYVIPKAMTVSGLETALNRTDLAELAVELEALGVDGDDPWYMFTSDTTAFAP